MLSKGIVCDECNNYFSRKVEGPFLNNYTVKNQRARQLIPTKKKKYLPHLGIYTGLNVLVELCPSPSEGLSVGTHFEKDEGRWVRHILSQKSGTIILPIEIRVDPRVVARFLAKIALESVAYRLSHIPGFQDYIVSEKQFDAVRRYARHGDNFDIWKFHKRTIYGENDGFCGSQVGASYQVLHEFDFLYTEQQELYLVLAIFGTEYVFNLAGPEIEGYEIWLQKHGDVSPLYYGKNDEMPLRVFSSGFFNEL